MQPLSPVVRRIYLFFFVILFAILLPIAIFYADGWRYRAGFGFVRTGGIYIGVPYQDAEVNVNGEFLGRSGFLDRSFYLGDLAPASYTVSVSKEGFRPWTRQLTVEEQLVTDARALLLPIEITPIRLMLATSSESVSTETLRILSRTTWDEYTAIFAATTTASSTLPVDEQEGIGLFIERGALFAKWIQDNAFPPSQFCKSPSSCTESILLEDNARVITARFFRGGVVYATESGEVHFMEPDVRPAPIHMLFFSAPRPDIRIIDDVLIVKSGTNYYEISL